MKPLTYSWNGEGTEQSPYEIKSYAHLKELGDNVDWGKTFEGIYFQVMADIDLSGKAWSAIGDNTNTFCGIFDGNHKAVSNMKMKNKKLNGLFGCLGRGEKGTGTITNLTVTAAETVVDKGTGVLGLLAGYNYGEIRGCICQGNIKINRPNDAEPLYAGLLTGVNQEGGKIERCIVKGEINLISDGAKQQDIGGLVGSNAVGGSIIDCTSEGTMIGTNRVAGICGVNAGLLKGSKNCGFMEMKVLTLPAYIYPLAPDVNMKESGGETKNGCYSVILDKCGNKITINIGKGKVTTHMDKNGVIYIKKEVPLYLSEGASASFAGVIMDKGAYILIRGNVDFKTDSLEIVDKLESNVEAVKASAETDDLSGNIPVEGANIIVMPKATGCAETAANGKDGMSGGSGGNGFVGGAGGSGGNGRAGENGLGGAGNLQVSIGIEDLCNDLVIASVSLNGQAGGKGGSGGAGGAGGIGEQDLQESKEKKPKNGKGGDGGDGGKGGTGGNGGDGNIIKVLYKTNNESRVYPKEEKLGKGGAKGMGGCAGQGGITPFDEEALEQQGAGKDGKPGKDGLPGIDGSPGLIEIQVKDVN